MMTPCMRLLTAQNTGLDAVLTDLGAGRGRFRPASLRNIAVTAPYMHDGRFATLRHVIEHYTDQHDQDAGHHPYFSSALANFVAGSYHPQPAGGPKAST